MPDPITAPETPVAVSPTGEAMIPPVVAKWVAPFALAAGIVVMEGADLGLVVPGFLLPWIKLVYLLGTIFGIVSPGARKKAA